MERWVTMRAGECRMEDGETDRHSWMFRQCRNTQTWQVTVMNTMVKLTNVYVRQYERNILRFMRMSKKKMMCFVAQSWCGDKSKDTQVNGGDWTQWLSVYKLPWLTHTHSSARWVSYGGVHLIPMRSISYKCSGWTTTNPQIQLVT